MAKKARPAVEVTHPQQPVAVQSYQRAREDIQSGDVLMFRGAGLTDLLVSIGTDSPYSHAAIAFRSGTEAPFVVQPEWGSDRVCLVEAVGAGVREALLSEELQAYHGVVELWRVRAPGLSAEKLAKVVAMARRFVGVRYAFALLFYFVFDFFTLGLFRLRSRSRSRKELFCSQLVSLSYRAGGKLDLCPRYGDAATAPGDLISGARLEFVRVFARNDVVDQLARAGVAAPPP